MGLLGFWREIEVKVFWVWVVWGFWGVVFGVSIRVVFIGFVLEFGLGGVFL